MLTPRGGGDMSTDRPQTDIEALLATADDLLRDLRSLPSTATEEDVGPEDAADVIEGLLGAIHALQDELGALRREHMLHKVDPLTQILTECEQLRAAIRQLRQERDRNMSWEELGNRIVRERVVALTDAQLAKIVWDSVDIAELYETDSVDVSTLRAALLTALGGAP